MALYCESTEREGSLVLKLTRSPLRSQVPQHNNSFFTLLDASTLDGGDKVLFPVECSTLAGELETFLASDLGNGSSGSEVALENSIRSIVIKQGSQKSEYERGNKWQKARDFEG